MGHNSLLTSSFHHFNPPTLTEPMGEIQDKDSGLLQSWLYQSALGRPPSTDTLAWLNLGQDQAQEQAEL